MGSLFNSQEIAAMSGGFLPAPPKDYQLPTIFPAFGNDPVDVALDYESFDPDIKEMGPGWRRNAYPVGISVAIRDRARKIVFKEYYPMRHKSGPNLDPEKVYEWLSDNLTWFRGKIVGANLLYDGDGLQYQGVTAPLAKWTDVQWAEALIDENAYNYTLERLGQKYLGHGKITDELKGLYGPDYKFRFAEIHPGHARAYGLGDVELPLLIEEIQEEELARQKLETVWDIERRLFPFLLYMRRKGQRVDMAAASRLHDMFTTKRADCLAQATKAIGKRGVELNIENFGKPSVLVAAFEALGIPIIRGAESNKASFTDDWLHGLCSCKKSDPKNPSKMIDDQECGHVGRLIESANGYDKALETFVHGYIADFAIKGRVHCEFHPLRRVDDENGKHNGTVSGRFSSVHPNLQNIPVRDSEIGPLLRACFIPESDSYDFFSGDYSQIEFRLLVHAAVVRAQYSADKAKDLWGTNKSGVCDIWNRLQAAYKAQKMYVENPDTDFHNMVVELTGLERKYAKNINFGIAFTMGVEKLARSLGVPYEEALKILGQYHEKVPFVKAVGQAMTIEAEDSGVTATILGRLTHFDDWEPKKYEKGVRYKAYELERAMKEYGLPQSKLKRAMTHKALNCYTQGSGADLMKTAMVKIWESGVLSGDDLIISLTVHDELDGSVARTAAAKEKLREVQHLMENSIQLCVPTTTEFKTGKDWSATH